MIRIYHPFHLWEDWKSGMWRKISGKSMQGHLERAIEFTGNHELYGMWMMRVIHEWPFSCEHNLTDLSQNRRAWIGHAACQMAIGCPEHITRSAWSFLSKEQQVLANMAADRAIERWELLANKDLK